MISLGEFMDKYWEEQNQPNNKNISVLDGFVDVELRGGELGWSKKSQNDLMSAVPSIFQQAEQTNYGRIYQTTSTDPHTVNKEEINPYEAYDRAMGILEKR